MRSRGEQVWILASAAPAVSGIMAAVALEDWTGRSLTTWRGPVTARSAEGGALLAIVEGLRKARDRGAREVTVLCPFRKLAARLNRREPIAWNDPLARSWMQARALSHTFGRCEFHYKDAASTGHVTELALSGILSQPLAQAA
ncbi:MAG: reverse transcriptase-like protein [Armatimonadota bacterium]|nr:reverse transcriptase-like protein [Armatimonadota bacterium]